MRNPLALLLMILVLLCSSVQGGDVVFPHVAAGPHYQTELKITNNDAITAAVVLSFFSPNGESTSLFSPSPTAIEVPPKSTRNILLARGLRDASAWAHARSSATISGVLQISYIPAAGVYSSSSFDNLGLLSAARIIGEDTNTFRRTGIAICNPSEDTLDLDLEVFDRNTQPLGKLSWSVLPRNQRALYLEELNIPGAHSVEVFSRSGLFSAISVSQNATELFANQVSELTNKRFVMQQEKLDLNFTAYQIKTARGIGVITGDNGVNIFDINRKILIGTVPLQAGQVRETIAFHPVKPLVAVGGLSETIVIDLNSLAVVKRFVLERASVGFDDLTHTFLTAVRVPAGLGSGTRITAYNENFEPIATNLVPFGPGRLNVRNGIAVIDITSHWFVLFRVPSLEVIVNKPLPGTAPTYLPRISGDNIVVFGPENPNVFPADNVLSFYYVSSGRTEVVHFGDAVDTKVVQKERVYLTNKNKLIVVDLLQRRVIQSSELSFRPTDIDFYVEANALVALDQKSLWTVRLAAQ